MLEQHEESAALAGSDPRGCDEGRSLIAEGVGEKRRETGTNRTGGPASAGAGTLTAKSSQEHRASADTATVMPEASTGRDATLADTKRGCNEGQQEQRTRRRDSRPGASACERGRRRAWRRKGRRGRREGAWSRRHFWLGLTVSGAGRGGGPVLDPADDPRRVELHPTATREAFSALGERVFRYGRRSRGEAATRHLGDDRCRRKVRRRGACASEWDHELNENIRKAIGRAFPFEPLPAALGLSQPR